MNDVATETITGTEIVPIEVPDETAMAFFSGDFATTIEPKLAPIKVLVEKFLAEPPSVDNEEGRETIKAFAWKLTKSRTTLEAAGKRVADEVKKLPKTIDANRKKARETFEGWENQVRGPLDAWEEAEEARKARHSNNIAAITLWGRPHDIKGNPWSAETLRENMGQIQAVYQRGYDEGMGEFADEYEIARRDALGIIGRALEAAEKREAEEKELAALRAAQAEQEAKEREAERKRLAAEKAHAAELAAAKRRTDEAIAAAAAAERAKIAAEEAAKRAVEDALIAQKAALAAEEEKRKADAAKAEADAWEKAALERRRGEVIEEIAAAISACLHGGDEGAVKGPIKGEALARRIGLLIATTIQAGLIPHVKIVAETKQ